MLSIQERLTTEKLDPLRSLTFTLTLKVGEQKDLRQNEAKSLVTIESIFCFLSKFKFFHNYND